MDVIKSVHIFQYIQEFLDSYEYLQLMNSNKKLFGEIKRDTVTYHFIMNDTIEARQLSYLGQMVTVVKDPKRQIFGIINFDANSNGSHLLSVRLLSPYLHSVEINTHGLMFTNEFDFSIFNNIPIVNLCGFRAVTVISKGLQNIQELTLALPHLVRIYDMNVTKSLRKLTFRDCPRLKSFPDQNNGSESLHDMEFLLFSSSSTSQTFTFQSINSHALDMTKLFSRFTQELLLEGDFSSRTMRVIKESSILFHIPKLTLIHNNESVATLLRIPFFYGKHLKLEGFDLSSWQFEKELPELLSLRLISCTNFNQLPIMPSVRRLKLFEMEGVKYIPTFMNLNKLTLMNVPTIERLDEQPNLKYLDITFCQKITNFDMFDGQFFRVVDICGNPFQDASPFRNSYDLSLSKCLNIEGIRFYDSYLPSSRRSLCLNLIIHPLEFTTFVDLNKLSLVCFPELDLDAIEIRNICDLNISVCNNYHSTANLHEIKDRLVLVDCENLSKLTNLQNIPEIVLGDLPSLNDISGLGNHRRVIVFNLPFLKDLAEEYARDRAYLRHLQNPYLDIFRTIDSFAVISGVDENFVFSWEFFDNYELTYFWGNETGENVDFFDENEIGAVF